jgi:hypothetical protein
MDPLMGSNPCYSEYKMKKPKPKENWIEYSTLESLGEQLLSRLSRVKGPCTA